MTKADLDHSTPTPSDGHKALLKAAARCPVAEIALSLARIEPRMDELEDHPGDRSVHPDRERDELDLSDLELHLRERVEWLTPTSDIGAMFTASMLRSVSVDGPEEEETRRKVFRLNARLMEYFEARTGLTYRQIGLERHFISHDRDTALKRHFAA